MDLDRIRFGIGALSLVCSILIAPIRAGAMSAEVLPKGVFRIGFDAAYKRATHYFTGDWGLNTESIVADYDGIDLGPSALFDLSGLPPGLGTWLEETFFLGRTNVALDSWAIKYQISLFYGITDRLSVGIVVPFTRGTYEFDIGLDNCKVRLNPNYDPNSFFPITDQLPILPTKIPEKLIDFDDANTIFTDPRYGFEYKPLPEPGKHTETGLNDMLFGLRYLFGQSETWRMAGSIWSMAPTGKFTDQNEVYSLKFGDGQWDLGFLWSVDYMPFGERPFLGIFRNLYLDLSAGYTFQFSDRRWMRIWSFMYDEEGLSVLPLATKESLVKVHRDYGDTIDLYMSGAVAIWEHFSFGFEFYGYYEGSDKYTGPNPWSPDNSEGHQYEAMEWETDRSSIDMSLYLAFSTIPLFMDGSFPLPFDLLIGYGRSVAGKNIDVVESWTLSFATYFSFDIFKGEKKDLPTLKDVPKVSK